MKKSIFVTGAGGFVASHLIPMLLDSGYKVCALAKKRIEKSHIDQRAVVVIGDLSKRGTWEREIKGYDVLIHLAAEISSKDPKNFVKNNVVATENLINAAKWAKISKIIHFSSAAVTSIRKDQYAQTKEEQEDIITKSRINYFILRPSMIYGPGDTKNIGWLIKIISRLPIIPLPGGGKFGRQPVYVGDICKIVIKLIEKKSASKISEIHGIEYVSMSKMARVISNKLKQQKLMFYVPQFLLIFLFWILEHLVDNPKFTVDQIKSLLSGERFSGDSWWKTFDIIPTKFEAGVDLMIKKD